MNDFNANKGTVTRGRPMMPQRISMTDFEGQQHTEPFTAGTFMVRTGTDFRDNNTASRAKKGGHRFALVQV